MLCMALCHSRGYPEPVRLCLVACSRHFYMGRGAWLIDEVRLASCGLVGASRGGRRAQVERLAAVPRALYRSSGAAGSACRHDMPCDALTVQMTSSIQPLSVRMVLSAIEVHSSAIRMSGGHA